MSTILRYKLNMLPKTKQYLIPLLESIEDFQIKRIKWAAKYIYEQDRKNSYYDYVNKEANHF